MSLLDHCGKGRSYCWHTVAWAFVAGQLAMAIAAIVDAWVMP